VSLYWADDLQVNAMRMRTGNIDQTFLKDFILYARGSVAPEIGEDAVEGLVKGYLDMRR
jgi:DNA replicative helicase MCM subunit Mcm2 (Cdc46/Mcm family)